MLRRMPRSTLLIAAVLVCMVALSVHGGDGHDFVGTKKCRTCHLKQWKSWSETKMANAYELLKPGERAKAKKAAGLDPSKDYTADATCLPCHVTGYGKAGGFQDIGSTPELAGVGCEMCHGAGGTYLESQYMSVKNKEYKKADVVAAGMVDQVSEVQCTGCHNADSPFVGDDFVFDFDVNKAKGTHENFPLKYKH